MISETTEGGSKILQNRNFMDQIVANQSINSGEEHKRKKLPFQLDYVIIMIYHNIFRKEQMEAYHMMVLIGAYVAILSLAESSKFVLNFLTTV